MKFIGKILLWVFAWQVAAAVSINEAECRRQQQGDYSTDDADVATGFWCIGLIGQVCFALAFWPSPFSKALACQLAIATVVAVVRLLVSLDSVLEDCGVR